MSKTQWSIAIFDGDNTLWDTNEVFTEAQINVLRGLKKLGYGVAPDKDFGRLREIDDLLIKYSGRREYNSAFLPLCLMRSFSGIQVQDVRDVSAIVGSTEEKEFAVPRELGMEFDASLKRIPNLFPAVIDTLTSIRRTERVVLVLYSEGNESRLNEVCNHDDMRKYFHEIIIGDKSLEDWNNVKQRSYKLFESFFPNLNENPSIYVIGDLLARDIGPGNIIGAVTIYKPGGYKGTEVPRSPEEKPAFTVRSLEEIIPIVL
jgi:phosphoglycolate phosphatase-like HAD superfamily hydrolase